ncbi:MAG TPA: T9SS type A sorting domain-containing protein [Bacteroidetes bacterium]|nr:T9SS type A sorting domain-containing protein [Bacteroidota bacterium]
MKTKSLFIFIVFLFLAKQSNAQLDFFKVIENDITIVDCNVGQPVEIPFEVSGLTSKLDADYNLQYVIQNANFNSPVNIELTLTSPQGTTVRIGSSAEGSWPNIEVNSNTTIASDICKNDPHNTSTTGTFIKVKPLDDYSAFEGENPNGTWTFKICSYNNEFTLHYLAFAFSSFSPAPEISSTINTTDCQSNDGSVELKFPLPKCSPPYQIDGNTKYVRFISMDGTNWEEKYKSDITIENLSAGVYTVYVTRDDGNRQPDPNYVTTVDFIIGATNDNQPPLANCKSSYTVQLDANGMATIDPVTLDNGSSDNCSKTLSFTASPNTFDVNDVNVQNACGLNALDFNLSTSGNSYGISQNPIVHGDNFTYEAWVNVASNGSTFDFQGILTTETIPDDGAFVQMAISSDVRLIGEIRSINNPIGTSNFYGLIGQNPLSTGWNHIAITFNGQNMKLYLNGNEQQTTILTGDSNLGGNIEINDVVHMGAERLLNTNGFSSLVIDEARIWNIVKSESEIQANLVSCLSGTEQGLIAYWDVEGGSGNIINEKVAGNQMNLINTDDNNWVPGAPQIISNDIPIVLTVSDANGNSSNCVVNITVEDKIAPELICHNYDINLNNSVTNYDITIDDILVSATDAAGIATISFDKKSFTCSDFGVNMVTIEATDANGNVGNCQTMVNVNDIAKPTFTNCPQDMTVALGLNGEATANFTTPTFLDNCEVTKRTVTETYTGGATNSSGQISYTGNFADNFMVNKKIIGAGNVTIEFKAEDAANNSISCTMMITITTADPCANDTQAPEIWECPVSGTVLLDNNNEAAFWVTDPNYYENCEVKTESLKITYMDGATNENGETSKEYTSIDQGKIYKYWVKGQGRVQFEYKVTDKAGNSSTCVAVITSKKKEGPCANDATPPQLSNCQQDFTVELDPITSSAKFKVTTPDLFDACGIASTKVQLNYLDGTTGPNGELTRSYNNIAGGVTSNDFLVIGSGRVSFKFKATDPEGNSSSCTAIITAKKAGNDVVFSMASGCSVPGLKTLFPVRVTNFTKVGAYSFDLSLPANSGLSFANPENINMTNFSYNILDNGDLRISWYDQAGGNITLDDFTRIFDIAINASDNFNQAAKIEAKDLVILSDIGANISIEGGNICVGEGVSPSGTIKNIKGIPQSGVRVNLTSGNDVLNHTETNANGEYSFSITNKSERIAPYKNDNVRQGVEIVDVAKIRRHFLETAKLDNPYNQIAADVNKDGRINVLDVAFTNRVFLKKINSFPGNTAWRYFPTSFDVNNNPLDPDNPQFLKLDIDGLDFQNLNFVSVKTGDVDNSALSSNSEKEYLGSRSAVGLSVPDTVVDPSQNFTIPIYISGGQSVSLFSLTMDYDTNMVKLESISSSLLPGFSAGNYNDLGGNILIGWDHPSGNSVTGDGVFLNLEFSAKASSGTSQLQFNDIKLYNSSFELFDINIDVGNIELNSTATNDLDLISDMSIYPNPFNNNVFVDVKLNQASKINISLTDIYGKIIKSYYSDAISDSYKIHFTDIEYKGLILVKLEGNSFQKVYKLTSF